MRMVVLSLALIAVSCASPSSSDPTSVGASTSSTSSTTTSSTTIAPTTTVAAPLIPDEPADDVPGLVRQIIDLEDAIRDSGTAPADLDRWGRLQQSVYARLAARPEWDEGVFDALSEEYRQVVTLHLEARRFEPDPDSTYVPPDTLPAWRIIEPAPVDELRSLYFESQSASGTPWEYLAAVNFIETRFGRIIGDSSAGAQGPMQFIPTTWEIWGEGGDVYDPRDSILAAGRFLAHFGAPDDMAGALFKYNPSDNYVQAVTAYARLLELEPNNLGAFRAWRVFYGTSSGPILLPEGYDEPEPVLVDEYLARS